MLHLRFRAVWSVVFALLRALLLALPSVCINLPAVQRLIGEMDQMHASDEVAVSALLS